MNQIEFYRYYIPALIDALLNEDSWEQYNVKGPEYYFNMNDEKLKEIELYIDQLSGHNTFLDEVGYYFDAKSHGFNEINGLKINDYRKNLENEILKYKTDYEIP